MSEEADTIETTEKVGQVASPETVPTEQSETVETVETAPVNQAEYDAAVAQGKQLAATITVNKLKLGELAAGIEAKYDRLADYAEATGVPYESLKKYRYVYGQYKDIDFGETSPPFGVLDALAAHPKREAIIKANPSLKVARARTIAAEYREAAEREADERWAAEREAEYDVLERKSGERWAAEREAEREAAVSAAAAEREAGDTPTVEDAPECDDAEAEAEADDDTEADEAEAEDADVSLDSAEADFRTKYQDRPWARDDRGFIRKALEFAQTVLTEFGHQEKTVDADILRDVLEDPERDVSKVHLAGEKLISLAKDWKEKSATVNDNATREPAE